MKNIISWKKSMPISIQQSRENPFTSLQTELDKAMKGFYNMLDFTSMSLRNFENLAISPAVDVVEDKDSFKIEAEMPGLGEDEVSVSINDGMLTIKGEKTTSTRDKGKNYLTREINYGSYERTMELPDTIDIDKAKASFKKGMLWVTIPKKEGTAQHSRKLKVEKVSDNTQKVQK